jgi:4,5-DOPA dioxygenase extradiol
VHPLGHFTPRFDGSPPERCAVDFERWLTDTIESGDYASLVAYRKRAPYVERAHPRPDHLMALLAAAGAGGAGRKMHDS